MSQPTGEHVDHPRESRAAPVASSQEGMLWHEQFAPGSFNLPPLVRRYQGHLDVKALRRSLSDIVRRHPPLRTTFEVVDGQPIQRVGSLEPLPLAVGELTGLDPSAQQAEVRRLVEDAARRPFDLARGPLFEPRLLRLGDDDHVLLIRLHHLVFDDWSVNVFRRELSALYAAHLAGKPPELPELRVEFAEFCRRQHRARSGPAATLELSWWRHQLEGAPFTVPLPIGDPERPEGSPHDAVQPLRVALSPALTQQLRALAASERTTLFMALLAVFSVLVHRSTAQDDLLLASVVANRNARELEPLIACFTKKILLRMDLSGDPTFCEVMRRAREAVLGALAHQDLPYETVVQEVLGGAAAAHGLVPDVSVMFQAEAPQKETLHLPGLTVGPFDSGTSTTQPHFAAGEAEADGDVPVWGAGLYRGTFLILSVLETPDDVSLVARGVFHPPAVEQLLARFGELLAEVVARPDRRLSGLGHGGASGSGAGRRRGEAPDGGTPSPGAHVELRGFRVDPSRVGTTLVRCPGVREAAVVAGEDSGETRLVAYVVPGDGAGGAPTLAGLRSFLWTELPGYAWPAAMVVMPALRRSSDGRLDAATLPAPDALEHARNPVPASTGEELLLASLWAEVLGVEEVGVDTNYWQRFSFVDVLARAAAAGMPVSGQQVRRNRILQTLAADLAASRMRARTGAPATAVTEPPGAKEPAARALSPTRSTGSGEVIRAEGLTKVYAGGRTAVDHLDLSVRAGEILGVLGPNGAGKTTTVGMLTGKVIPTSGSALVNGIDVKARPAAAKQFIGVVQQANTLDRGLDVWENLYFHARYFGIGNKAARAATNEMLERFRLVGREGAEVHTLSGGFARRVMLARAILHRPAVLFLDEPTAGLDPQTRLALWETLEELREGGQTIFMTTHYMEEADRLSDRVAVIDKGRILAIDTPAALKRSLGTGTALTVRAEGDLSRLAERLVTISGAGAVHRGDGHVRLRLAAAEHSLARVIAAAEQASCKITDLSLQEGTLEDVFINLTGRELRE